MRQLTKSVLLGLALLAMPRAGEAASTLVIAEGGSFKPGMAKSWSKSDDGLTLTLAEGVDGAATAATLRERLAQAKVSYESGKIVISGIPPDALLEQLSTLNLVGGEGDPLAALAGLGGEGVPTAATPEGGGSIRASRPTPLAGMPIPVQHDAAERCEAEVLAVTRGAFPQVTLKLKVRKSAKAGPLRAKLRAGKVLEVPVLLAGGGSAIDLAQALNQTNLGAYYLHKGDRVMLHALEAQKGSIAVDWIERK